jgi:hypothetical protein
MKKSGDAKSSAVQALPVVKTVCESFSAGTTATR